MSIHDEIGGHVQRHGPFEFDNGRVSKSSTKNRGQYKRIENFARHARALRSEQSGRRRSQRSRIDDGLLARSRAARQLQHPNASFACF